MKTEIDRDCFVEELAGVAAVGPLQRTLAEHARALRVMIEEESRKPFPNNHLIAVLMDAACLGHDHLKMWRNHRT